MSIFQSRRGFLKTAVASAGAIVLPHPSVFSQATSSNSASPNGKAADHTVRIKVSPIEVARDRIVSTTNYNGQFPGPLIRVKEGQPATIDIFNDTDVPEQLHWHGQRVPVDIDGAAEEGTPYIAAHGKRRVTFIPGPAGFRFYHTHNRAGANLTAAQYNGEVGPVYVEPKNEPGNYDREIFLVLKEFEPTLSRGGDMPQNFLPPITTKELEERGESAKKASLAKGMPHGYEVGYGTFTINGRMLVMASRSELNLENGFSFTS